MELPRKKKELVKFTSDYLADWFKNWNRKDELGDIISYHYDYEIEPIFIPYLDDGKVRVTSFVYDKNDGSWSVMLNELDCVELGQFPMKDLRKLFWNIYQVREND